MQLATAILDQIQRDNYKERNGIGLSEIGKCPRRLWYKTRGFAGVPERIESQWVFQLGHSIEALIVEKLLGAGYRVTHYGDNQETVTLGGFAGHPDGRLYLGGKRYVLEVKSASEWGFKAMCKNGIEATNPDYYLQALAYIEASGADGAVFLVGNKAARSNDANYPIYEEWIMPDPAFVRSHIARLTATLELWEPPMRPEGYTVKKFPCSYCEFAATCWDVPAPLEELPGADA